MKVKISLIMSLLFFVGCEIKENYKLSDHKCSVEQMVLVKAEFEICRETDYLNSYCLEQARKSHCSNTEQPQQER